MKHTLLSQLNAECPWRDTLLWFDTIDSTNTYAKTLAAQGAPHGTVILAGHQTGGRGRMGRSFSSPAGKGLYLSVILRPGCQAQALMHLTCAAGVAACNAIQRVTGLRPGIKWINDLIVKNKKLGGILTELSVDPADSTVQYAVIGIGINCENPGEDFPQALQDIAISLEEATGKVFKQSALAAALIEALWQMDGALLSGKKEQLDSYRADCLTLGKTVQVIRGDQTKEGVALALDDDGGLLVRYRDGATETVNSGEVSIRGIAGYL